MTAHESEAADNLRLKRAQAHIEFCREAESQARVMLAQAVADTKRAREKWEQLFNEYQDRAVERRKAGLIVNNPGY